MTARLRAAPRLWSGREADRLAPLAPNAWLRFDMVSRMFPAGVGDVLEIGCGRGAFGVRIAKTHGYLGLEPDRASFEAAAARFARAGLAEVRNVAVEDLPPGSEFDLVCAFEVLEHIEDDAAALDAWLGRLRPGGWISLSVPAHQRRYGPFDELVGHFRRYDPPALARQLQRHGCEQVEIREYGMPLGFVLEAGRNAIGRRRLAGAAAQTTMRERTGSSARQLQPGGGLAGAAARAGTAPFRLAQRGLPAAPGTGLVALARLAGG